MKNRQPKSILARGPGHVHFLRTMCVLGLTVMLGCVSTHGVVAQELSDEMKETFRDMIPKLDSDLQSKVRDAIRSERDYLELTPDQFKRFRDHPANPFEGWDGIDPDGIDGLIRLRFESQPIRTREPGQYERQSTLFLKQQRSVTHRAAASTVVILDGKVQVALGTVISAEGHVVTKLSEIEDCETIFCRQGESHKWPANVLARNRQNDLAILKIPAGVIPAVTFATNQPEIGSFLFSTNCQAAPMAMGVYSNPPRSLIGKNQAFLGVKPMDDIDGVRVVEVTEGSSADNVGLRVGDVLVAINGQTLSNVQSLVNEIRKNSPGDSVNVEFVRNGKISKVAAVLAGRNVGGPTADRFKQMNTFGAIQSNRRDEFPLVFQHDTPLVPEQCGGPITNLDGQVIGINIARGGRVATYAIPADHLQVLVREMLRPSIASSDLK